MKVDEGSISKAKDCTIGFLNQDLLSFQSEDAILTVAMMAFKDAVDTQRQIEKVLHQLETAYSDELVDKLTHLQEKFEQLDGYTMQAKAEEVLEGIGFSTSDLHRPLKEFSGGWRMRVMLAKLLLETFAAHARRADQPLGSALHRMGGKLPPQLRWRCDHRFP